MGRLPHWTGHLDLTRLGLFTYIAVLRGDGWETPPFMALGRRRTVRKATRHARSYGIELRDAASHTSLGAEEVAVSVSTA